MPEAAEGTAAGNKYRSHDEQVPFSRAISTVLTGNKYRSHDKQVPFSREGARQHTSGQPHPTARTHRRPAHQERRA